MLPGARIYPLSVCFIHLHDGSNTKNNTKTLRDRSLWCAPITTCPKSPPSLFLYPIVDPHRCWQGADPSYRNLSCEWFALPGHTSLQSLLPSIERMHQHNNGCKPGSQLRLPEFKSYLCCSLACGSEEINFLNSWCSVSLISWKIILPISWGCCEDKMNDFLRY